MLYTTIEIHIPEAMKPYVTEKNAEDELQRNALLLYPYVLQKKYQMEELRRSWEFQN